MKKLWILLVVAAVVAVAILAWPGDTGDRAPEPPGGESPSPPVPATPVTGTSTPALPEPPTPEPAGATFRFTVQDADGAPIKDAEAGVWNERQTCTATADQNGTATLSELEPGTYHAWAVAEGYAGEEQYDLEIKEDQVRELSFTLEAGVPYRGTVVDALTGQPVREAAITVQAGGSVGGYSELKSRGPYDRVFTDEEGKFLVRGIPFEAVGTLVVEAEGYRVTREGVQAPVRGATPPADLIIRLDPGASLFGIVYGPDGKPLPGAMVFVVPAHHEMLRENPHITSTGSGGLVKAVTATTGEDGSYEIQGLAFGSVMVAMAEGARFARSADSSELLPTADNRAIRVDLTLRRPAVLELTVNDENGEPAEGVRCHIDGFMSGFSLNQPDEAGLFRFTGLRPGEHVATLGSMRFVDTDIPLDLPAGETTRLTVELDPGAIVSGVLVDGKGQPVPGARVSTEFVADPVNTSSNSNAETDEMGLFTLRGLKSGAVRLTARKVGFKILSPPTVVAPIDDVRLVGAYLGKARVAFKTPDGSLLPERAFVWRFKGGGGSGSGEDVPDGVLEFEGFTGETETLDVRFPGFVPWTREVTISPGESVDLGIVTLDSGVTLTGVITDLLNEPVAGAEVSWEGPSTAASDTAGRFELQNVPAGELELTVDAEGFLIHEETLQTNAGEVRIRLARGALVTVNLKAFDGRPVTGDWLRLLHLKGEKLEFEDADSLDETGSVTLRVPAGRYRIETEGDGSPITLTDAEFKEGEVRTLDLTRPE